MNKDVLKRVTDEAMDAFGEILVRNFPEATSGDLSPEITMQLVFAMEAAIKQWVSANVPKKKHGKAR